MRIKVLGSCKYYLNNGWHEVTKGQVLDLKDVDAKELLTKDKKHFKKIKK